MPIFRDSTLPAVSSAAEISTAAVTLVPADARHLACELLPSASRPVKPFPPVVAIPRALPLASESHPSPPYDRQPLAVVRRDRRPADPAGPCLRAGVRSCDGPAAGDPPEGRPRQASCLCP